MKEQVSVDECIECLQEYISKRFNTELAQDLSKGALDVLIIKIGRLKRLDENVKREIEAAERVYDSTKSEMVKIELEALEKLYK